MRGKALGVAHEDTFSALENLVVNAFARDVLGLDIGTAAARLGRNPLRAARGVRAFDDDLVLGDRVRDGVLSHRPVLRSHSPRRRRRARGTRARP